MTAAEIPGEGRHRSRARARRRWARRRLPATRRPGSTHNRRWCSMSRCGNRTRAHRHQTRAGRGERTPAR
ncbi:CGNR zinc finger domain-containing protein [Streptomyces iakyrus]|uniref:CGNR zinc finger domain-containing protein n=1 Tax=Streptomyces iakyrus TaxID=68219 RepID=UPI0036BEA670